ncbi:hypothetical protein [Rhizobium ruizarguesonis]|uniref:hypothetical protein n=1 Tax=Rhizobium ruizarguesonis TaxID=2081791 RepID=UPI00102FA5EA|nr:hypothetical protein [Rhizobium ruizarguesonis]TAT69970.1 hypothetical protein ELI52_38740 [Rhizobium ruizarguesonis]
MLGSLPNVSNDSINLAIRIVLGIDVAIFLAVGTYYFILNERLASKASKFGNITYTTPFTIHTGIAWGSPDCPQDIRNEYLHLRRQLLKHNAFIAIPMLIYLIFLRPYYH